MLYNYSYKFNSFVLEILAENVIDRLHDSLVYLHLTGNPGRSVFFQVRIAKITKIIEKLKAFVCHERCQSLILLLI